MVGDFIKCALKDDTCSTWHKILNMLIKEGASCTIMPFTFGQTPLGSAMFKSFEGGLSFFRGVLPWEKQNSLFV